MKRGISFLLFATLTGCGSAPNALFGAEDAGPAPSSTVRSAQERPAPASGGAPDVADAGEPAVATGGSGGAPAATLADGGATESPDAGSGGATMGTGGAAQGGSGGLWCAAWGCGTGSAGSAAGGHQSAGGTTGTGGSDGPPNGGVCDPVMCTETIPPGATHICRYSLTGTGPWVPTCGYVCGANGCNPGTGGAASGGATGAGGSAFTCGSPDFGSCPVGMICDQGVAGIQKYWFCHA